MLNVFRWKTHQQEEKESVYNPVIIYKAKKLYSDLAKHKTNHPDDKISTSKRLKICKINGKIRYTSNTNQVATPEGKTVGFTEIMWDVANQPITDQFSNIFQRFLMKETINAGIAHSIEFSIQVFSDQALSLQQKIQHLKSGYKNMIIRLDYAEHNSWDKPQFINNILYTIE